MSDKVYVGAVLKVVVDSLGEILAGETITVEILKPGSDTPIIRSATAFEATKVKFINEAGDFDIPGVYKFQICIESSAGKWRGETASQTIYDYFK